MQWVFQVLSSIMFERHLPYLLKLFNLSPQQKDDWFLLFLVFFTIFPFFCVILMRQKLYLCDKKCNGKPGSYCIFM